MNTNSIALIVSLAITIAVLAIPFGKKHYIQNVIVITVIYVGIAGIGIMSSFGVHKLFHPEVAWFTRGCSYGGISIIEFIVSVIVLLFLIFTGLMVLGFLSQFIDRDNINKIKKDNL